MRQADRILNILDQWTGLNRARVILICAEHGEAVVSAFDATNPGGKRECKGLTVRDALAQLTTALSADLPKEPT